MARRRFKRKRGRFAKKNMRKRILRRAHADGRSIFKLRGVTELSCSAGGQLTHTVSLNNPGAWYDGGGALSDLSNLTALYDSARICAIKLKFIPKLPNDFTSVGSYMPLYIVRDDDDDTTPGSVSEMVQYEKLSVKNLYLPWSYYTKVPRVSGFKTGVFVQVGSMGWYDLAAAQSIGAIKLYSTGLNATGISYGTLVATYYIAFKSRR